MTRRVVRFVTLTAVVAAAVAVARALTTKRDPLPTPPSPSGEAWPPVTSPSEPASPASGSPASGSPASGSPASENPAPKTAPEPAGVPVSDGSSWVDPTPSGACPDGYPVKAKMNSKIFHSPGQLNYERTTPDRCYRDAAAAEADGLRAAKR